jgi:glycosyltransferase involved in cell wall biosynthesis
LFWANRQIHNCRDNLSGKWIYILDDDDYLTDDNFIKDLKEIDADIVICKGYIGKTIYPINGYWNAKPFVRGSLGSPNFVVKSNLFLKNSIDWCRPAAADFFFIHAASQGAKIHWHNKKVFRAPIGNSKVE